MKYILIDGNNLGCRCAFGNSQLKTSDGRKTGMQYGFLQSLVMLRNMHPDGKFLVCWDGKSARRNTEANAAVKKGLIKEGYKENRKKDPPPPELLDFFEQVPFLQRALGKMGVPQIRLESYETDDVLAAYSKRLKSDNEVICVTTDKDYYQILDDNIKLYRSSRDANGTFEYQIVDKTKFMESNNITPEQHVHCGALSGDTGDNIFGIPGWGDKTSLAAIQEYGTFEGLFISLHKRFDSIRKEFPDVSGEEFERLRNLRTPKEEVKFQNGEEWKGKYPEIFEGMPFSGVALAFEEKRWKPDASLKKNLKSNLLALMFEERVALAYSLKKMDDEIDDLPEIVDGSFSEGHIQEYLDYNEMFSLKSSISVFKPEGVES